MHQEGIRLKNLTLSYQRHPAVHHLNGFFGQGTMTAIMGPNGGGKSTLMRALAGLHPIDEGVIERSPQQNLSLTAYLPQNLTWDRQFPMTVQELAEQALLPERRFWKGLTVEQSQRIEQALTQVGLWDLRQQSIGSLSLGQFQRALFARVIVQNAQVVLLDEPLTGLDEKSCDRFFQLMHQWNKEGKTLIVVLHDRHLAIEHFETTLILANESLAWGPSREILETNLWREALLSPSKRFANEEECAR